MSKKELRERATIKKAEIDQAEIDRRIAEEARIKSWVETFLGKCHRAMEEAADAGKFSVEVEVGGGDEVKRRLAALLSEYSPKWYGDGYTKEFINLSW